MSFSTGTLSQFWLTVQGGLFPWLEAELGELSGRQKRLVEILELTRIEDFVPREVRGRVGRPAHHRRAMARAFLAKACYNLETTRQLLERLGSDAKLRRICGWERASEVPGEATFSRAFAEFAANDLAARVHAQVIETHQKPRLVGHISRDATAIAARERGRKRAAKPEEKPPSPAPPPTPRRKKGDPPKIKAPTRLERQREMTLAQMLEELPTACDWGAKRNSQGRKNWWRGYKLHLDVADGGIPISGILTSASVNDSQVALPLATLTAQRVTSLYDLMDAGYDASIIREHSRSLGHIPLIDSQGRWGTEKVQFAPHEAQRYKERTTVERVYARLKEEFGGRMIRVRGATKVMASLMFGLLALTADQLIRLVS